MAPTHSPEERREQSHSHREGYTPAGLRGCLVSWFVVPPMFVLKWHLSRNS